MYLSYSLVMLAALPAMAAAQDVVSPTPVPPAPVTEGQAAANTPPSQEAASPGEENDVVQTEGGVTADNTRPLSLPRPSQIENSGDPLLDFPDGVSSSDRILGRRMSGGSRSGSRGTTVIDRRRPDYDAQGITAGSFLIFPLVSLSGNATSNVFRQNSGRSDVFLSATSELGVQSNWSRHALNLAAFVEQRAFATYTSEDTTVYRGRLSGIFDVSRGIALNVSAAHRHDYADRRAVEELIVTREPIRFDEDRLEAGITTGFNHLTAEVEGAYFKRNYLSAQSLSGAPIDTNIRDVQSHQIRTKIGYELSPARQVYLSASYEDRDFRVRSAQDRNVAIIEILAGLSSEITPLVRGRIAFGYIQANFRDPLLSNRGGLAIDAELSYLFTELTTFSLTARRVLGNVSQPQAPAAFITSVEARADHELLRNVILTGGVVYQRGDYVASPLLAQSYGVTFGGQWLLNRRWRVSGDIGARRSTSNAIISARQSEALTARAGVTFQM